MPQLLTLAQVRSLVQSTLEEVASWCVAKPRLFDLPRPEQQIQFEVASRLREGLRSRLGHPTWDRLHYDAAMPRIDPDGTHARPPIFVDTRQVYGSVAAPTRSAAEPDLAIAVHVLRTSRTTLELDENGAPSTQAFLPANLLAEGAALEARVEQLERLSHSPCDSSLFVVYSNDARRKTAVDRREIASWASWHTPLDTLWWTVRHFRAKAR
jgi:hypothetical protein